MLGLLVSMISYCYKLIHSHMRRSRHVLILTSASTSGLVAISKWKRGSIWTHFDDRCIRCYIVIRILEYRWRERGGGLSAVEFKPHNTNFSIRGPLLPGHLPISAAPSLTNHFYTTPPQLTNFMIETSKKFNEMHL